MSAPIRLTLVFGLLTVGSITSLQAQQPAVPGPSFKDIMDLHDIGSAVIAPDGNAIAYTVRSTDWDENGYDTEIWLVRLGEEPLQLTFTDKGSSTSPAWSPDGRWQQALCGRSRRRPVAASRGRPAALWSSSRRRAVARR